MRVLIVLFFLSILLGGCTSTKMYVLGVDIDEVAKEEDMKMIVFGVVGSVATHFAGHYVAAGLVGANIDQQDTRERITNLAELSDSDKRWFARGGFVAQTLVNTILTSFESTRKSKFTRGYTIGTTLQIGTYPLRRKQSDVGDLNCLKNNGGDADLEWTLYTGLSGYNFYRINKKKDLSGSK